MRDRMTDDDCAAIEERLAAAEHDRDAHAVRCTELVARVTALEARQQELLQVIVRLTNETPFPDEIKGWTEQRANLVAEVGTLRSRVSELESGR